MSIKNNVHEMKCANEIQAVLSAVGKEGINKSLLENDLKKKFAVNYFFIHEYLRREAEGKRITIYDGVIYVGS